VTSWLVLGGNGQLGRSLQEVLTERGIEHVALGSGDCDITDPASVAAALVHSRPDVVVNCAAWTAVDAAESHEPEALLVNAIGAGNVGRACREIRARLVHVSTDYVFPGNQHGPYGEDDPTGPASAYGRTKLQGEQAVASEHADGSYIVRTAWLYGPHGGNFAKTMLRRALAGAAVRVVDDQHGQPTLSTDLARHIVDLVTTGAPAGTYHGTNSGATTWFEFARFIYELAGVETSLVSPVPSSEYPTPATRPSNSVLGHARTVAVGVPEMRSWEAAISASINDIIESVKGEPN
jgi:dTDP-4-dehydrorhamnose reductase